MIVRKHGSTVDVSVIINAFNNFTNKVNAVNSLFQRRVDSWEKCLTVDETDNAADKEYSHLEYFNLDVEQNMCPSRIRRRMTCRNNLITKEKAKDKWGRINDANQKLVKKSLYLMKIFLLMSAEIIDDVLTAGVLSAAALNDKIHQLEALNANLNSAPSDDHQALIDSIAKVWEITRHGMKDGGTLYKNTLLL
eukprot:g273.t1